MPTVTFWFDFISPYAYFASRRIRTVCDKAGAALRLQPVLFAALLDHWGQKGPAEIAPKRVHTFKHIVRHAVYNDIPLGGPATHPFNPITALRVALPEVSGPDQEQAMHAIFDAGWGRGADLGDPAAIVRALQEVDLDGEALVARTREPAVKQALKDATAAAIRRGVFGVPTMTVGDELFWGHDQLGWLARYLGGEDPRIAELFQHQLDRPAGAVRPGSR